MSWLPRSLPDRDRRTFGQAIPPPPESGEHGGLPVGQKSSKVTGFGVQPLEGPFVERFQSSHLDRVGRGSPDTSDEPADEDGWEDIAVSPDDVRAVFVWNHAGAVLVSEQHAVPHSQQSWRERC